MIVKVCGITRREDAEAAADASADAIGFIFYKPSPRYVTPERARELCQGLKLWKVGVFVNEDPEYVHWAMKEGELDVAQIYGASQVNPRTLRIWQAVRIPEHGGIALSTGSCEALFLDSSGNGVSFDWSIARAHGKKIMIAGGLNDSNVREAIRIAQPWGVDASSGLESAPGIKDHEKVRRFIAAAREIPT
ncbi:MAG: phosphoribosylanthranilate isomerase [Acidobacteriia bacterium]|nr:phosphoribosylanthranilate isomerase [Terriglobia bacterium]